MTVPNAEALRLMIRAAAAARASLEHADDPAAVDRARSVLDEALDVVAPATGPHEPDDA